MASSFELQYTRFFEKQWLGYDGKTRHLIEDKLGGVVQNVEAIEENKTPY